MKNKALIISLVLAVILIALFFVFQRVEDVDLPTEVEEDVLEQEIEELIIEIEQQDVVISGFAYSPNEITVQAGTMVVWRNDDPDPHTVTSDDGDELDSPMLSKGDSFSHVFNTVGTFNYHCAPHPYMEGRVIVVE